jgi:hypothetical protein
MPTLTSTDLSGDSQGKLNGHLKSEDFGTENSHFYFSFQNCS